MPWLPWRRRGILGSDGRLPVAEKLIGTVVHYYDHVGVAGVVLAEPLEVGETIHVLGHTTDFIAKVESMEIDHQSVERGRKGDDVGIRVVERARIHDQVYKVG
jgi:putative protease